MRGSDLAWGSQLDLFGVRNAIVPAVTDQAGCTAALQTRADSYLSADQLTGGAVVCLTTDAGALAELAIAQPDVAGNLTLGLTVWR